MLIRNRVFSGKWEFHYIANISLYLNICEVVIFPDENVEMFLSTSNKKSSGEEIFSHKIIKNV